jgi:hypothetical protein
VAAINKTVMRQLNHALKQIEEKILDFYIECSPLPAGICTVLSFSLVFQK